MDRCFNIDGSSTPIRNLINLQPTILTAVVASDRLGDILDLKPERDPEEDRKINPESLKGEVKVKNLDFRYGTRDWVLKDINLSINQGEKVALVGESGSGKTTLVNKNRYNRKSHYTYF